MPHEFALTVDANDAQRFRQILERTGHWDGTRRLKTLKSGRVAIPVTSNHLNWQQLGCSDLSHDVIKIDLPTSKKFKLKNPAEKLFICVRNFAVKHGIPWHRDLELSVPTHWECHGDLILLPETAFNHPEWQTQEFWQCVAEALSCGRLAQKFTVSTDGFRTPQVSLLLGTDGWVEQVDNGIRYTYDVTRCMFSAGNISEKLRVSRFNCRGEIVVDLYAGIGYFTLPYLVHAGADVVHACEWNPAAVEALEKNVKLNKVEDRCVVHFGDNRQVCPVGVADRVNLGLIPSSEAGWSVACAALKPESGGILHIHANVTSKPGKLDPGKPLPSIQTHDSHENTTSLMLSSVSWVGNKITHCVNQSCSDSTNEIGMVSKGTVMESCGYNCVKTDGSSKGTVMESCGYNCVKTDGSSKGTVMESCGYNCVKTDGSNKGTVMESCGYNCVKTDGSSKGTVMESCGYNCVKTDGSNKGTVMESCGYNCVKTDGSSKGTVMESCGYNCVKTDGSSKGTVMESCGYNCVKTDGSSKVTVMESCGYNCVKTDGSNKGTVMESCGYNCVKTDGSSKVTVMESCGYNCVKTDGSSIIQPLEVRKEMKEETVKFNSLVDNDIQSDSAASMSIKEMTKDLEDGNEMKAETANSNCLSQTGIQSMKEMVMDLKVGKETNVEEKECLSLSQTVIVCDIVTSISRKEIPGDFTQTVSMDTHSHAVSIPASVASSVLSPGNTTTDNIIPVSFASSVLSLSPGNTTTDNIIPASFASSVLSLSPGNTTTDNIIPASVASSVLSLSPDNTTTDIIPVSFASSVLSLSPDNTTTDNIIPASFASSVLSLSPGNTTTDNIIPASVASSVLSLSPDNTTTDNVIPVSVASSVLSLSPDNTTTDSFIPRTTSTVNMIHPCDGSNLVNVLGNTCVMTDNGKALGEAVNETASNVRESWKRWAQEVSEKVNLILLETHKRDWTTRIVHIEHVKSYAPHVDHLVLDLDCRPTR